MKILNLSISRKALLFAFSFLLTSGIGGIKAYADYCFFVKPSSWNDPYVWAWNNQNGTDENCTFAGKTGWPGDAMTLVDEEKQLYQWVSPEGKHPNMIIISDKRNNRMHGVNSTPVTSNSGGDTPFINGATYNSDSTYTLGGSDDPIPTDGLGKIQSWTDDNITVTVVCEGGTLYVTPYSEEVVKVFTLPKGIEGEERRSITVSATPSASYSVEDNEGEPLMISISNGAKVSIDRNKGLITFLDSEGNEKLSEAQGLRNLGNSHTVSFNSMDDTAFFGGGYNGSWGNIKGQTVTMNNTQNWGWEGGGYPRCITIPFAASTSGYGVLFDDHWRGATMQPSNDGLRYQSSAMNPISYYYVGGENLDEVIANYTLLTGRQDLPPYWALGYISSRYSYWSENEAQGIINDIKGAGIPLDGIVFDLGWEGATEAGMGNLDWYRAKFPDPEKMMKDWKDKGIHTIVITEPYFSQETVNYSYPASQGYFADPSSSNMSWVSHGNVGLIDATNPEAMDWMWTFYRDRTREGMSGWWLDLGEPEQHDADSHHVGGSVAQVHNEFGQLWVERVYKGLREEFPDMRPFIMPRAGTSGMQRFSTFPWTGDIARSWGGLAAQIPSLINMSMAGVSYTGSDVGGFACFQDGYTNPSLYLRWVEFAALSPMMRTHSKFYPEPTNSVYSSILPDVRKFINLRYQMLPYTYTLSYLNTTKGWPMARPACAFDADPRKLANSADSYLWGKDIFVAPVVNSSNSRSITFPDGEWVDFNDLNRVFRGGETINYPAPLNCLPYFMRRGSFIPMFTQSENFGSTSEISYEDITLIHSVDPTDEGVYEGFLFEDDRTSASSLEKGEYTLIHFRGEADGTGSYAVSIEPEMGSSSHFMPETRTIRLRLLGYAGEEEPKLSVDMPEAIDLFSTRSDENMIALKNSKEEVDNHPGHAYCRADNGELYVKTILPSAAKMTVSLGDIGTGVKNISVASNLSLEYVANTINYSVPAGYENISIEYVSPDGRILGVVSNLEADGFVHSIAVPEIDGFCIARLKACSENGTAEKTVKFMR